MTAEGLTTPVLIIIFNRPDTTSLVFEAIRRVRPKKLYIAADGPRPQVESDVELCGQARKVMDSVDWDCEVRTWHREENFGPDKGVSTAVDWFFETEPEGIVLEDDCLPRDYFFWFCQELLQRFRDDNRVMHICGSSLLGGWNNEKYSYYFSRNASVAGWASWRRAWTLFGFQKSRYEAIRKHGYFDEYFTSKEEKSTWFRIFDRLAAGPDKHHHWVRRWDFSRFIQSGLSIVPGDSLIKTLAPEPGPMKEFSDPWGADNMLRHPPFVIRNMEGDRLYFSTVSKGGQ